MTPTGNPVNVALSVKYLGLRSTVYSCTALWNKNIFTFLITTYAWSVRDHKQYLHGPPVVHRPPVENPCCIVKSCVFRVYTDHFLYSHELENGYRGVGLLWHLFPKLGRDTFLWVLSLLVSPHYGLNYYIFQKIIPKKKQHHWMNWKDFLPVMSRRKKKNLRNCLFKKSYSHC